MKRLVFCLTAVLPLTLTAACGQKGPLYLPPRNGTVVTRPASSVPAPSSNTPSSTPQTTNQTPSQDTTTTPSTQSGSSPSGALKQNTGPATQATGAGQSGNKNNKDNSQTPPKSP
jgi:predicted small lipoprotein YifL